MTSNATSLLRLLAILLVSGLFCSFSSAQTGFRWAKSGGSSLYGETGMDITTDKQGFIYLAAHHQNNATFLDSTLMSDGGTDFIVAKLTPFGELVWWDRRGSTADDRANRLDVAEDGSLYMAGYGKVSFPRHTRDALTVKYNPNGGLSWGKFMDGDEYAEGRGIATDPSMNCYMVGSLRTNGWYGTDTIHGHGGKDGYIVKFDSAGNYLWARSIGSAGDDESWSVDTDNHGNAYVSGWFTGTADFGSGISLTSSGSSEAYIVKYNPSGTVVWAKQLGGAQAEDIQTIKVSEDGSVYFAGNFLGSFSTTAGTVTSQGQYDLFFGKMDADGNLEWISSAGGPALQLPQDLALDDEENIYLGGLFFGYLAIGGDTIFSGAYDSMFLIKMDSNGNKILMEDSYFPADSRGVIGVGVDAAQNVTICGYYGTQLTLGQDTLYSVLNTVDFYVARYVSRSLSITLDSITGSPYCGSDIFQVHFSLLGMPESGNVFFLELSDETGSFSSPDTIGTYTYQAGGAIHATVPAGLVSGTGYRVRIVGSAPQIVSNDNGYDLTLTSSTSIPVLITGDSMICNGVPVLLLVDTFFVSQVWSTGDTTYYLLANQPGTYWVEATDQNGCTNRDEHFLTPCVGGMNHPRTLDVKVYPNPATLGVKLRVSEAGNYQWSLVNLSGQVLKQSTLTGGFEQSIDLSGLPRGCYAFKVTHNSGRSATRIILLN